MEQFLASGTHWRIFNFILFVGLLFFLLRKAVAEFWQNRAQTIVLDMEEASRARKEAGKKVFDLEARIARLDHEAQELVNAFREQGELEKKRIIEKATADALQLTEDAKRVMEQEVTKSKEQLKHQAIQLSVEIAERLLKEKLTATDQQKLRTDFLKHLEGAL